MLFISLLLPHAGEAYQEEVAFISMPFFRTPREELAIRFAHRIKCSVLLNCVSVGF